MATAAASSFYEISELGIDGKKVDFSKWVTDIRRTQAPPRAPSFPSIRLAPSLSIWGIWVPHSQVQGEGCLRR